MKALPFAVDVPEADVAELKRRLRETRWADDFGNVGWIYGVERGWLQQMVEHWAERFDWRAQEATINAFDHRLVDLDGVPVHFLHAPGRGPAPMPLVLTHGWPWTFWDYRDLIGPLSDPGAHGGDPADAFDVVVPSLPGFGFSAPLRTTGVGVRRTGEMWLTLMRDVLGYDRFAAAGGDWGAFLTYELGHAHPEHVIGCVLTLSVIAGLDRRDLTADLFEPDERWMVRRMGEVRSLIRSHLAVHRHDPQTLAYALVDSPVGTAAWLWERRHHWADHDGDVRTVFDPDFLCTTASIYWLTGTVGSSLRFYAESRRERWAPLHDRGLPVPTGYLVFPRDLMFVPRKVAAAHTDLRQWSVMPSGGHFGPAERPAAVVDELRAFYRELR